MLAKTKYPEAHLDEEWITSEQGDRLTPIPDAVTEGPHMISIPGPMGQNVPMVVNAALCFGCIPQGKESSGLIQPTSNGLIKP